MHTFIGSEGAKNLRSKFENMAKAGEEEAKKRAEEERARRRAREEKEAEIQRKQEEVDSVKIFHILSFVTNMHCSLLMTA